MSEGELGELPAGLVARVYELGRQAGLRARPDEAYRRGLIAGAQMLPPAGSTAEAAFRYGAKYGQIIAEDANRRQYWAGYTDAVRDLYGEDEDVARAAEMTAKGKRAEVEIPSPGDALSDTGTDNVVYLAAARCAQRPTRRRR